MESVIVSDVMTRDPITVKPDENLLNCARRMVKKKVGSVLLKDKKKLVGIVAERDILWALVKKSKDDLKNIKAKDISPKKIITTKPKATLKEAMSKMKKSKLKKLPVIDNNELIGIITIRDILSFNPEFYPELEEFSKIRQEAKKLKRLKKAKERALIHEGICEECGTIETLYRVNGMLV